MCCECAGGSACRVVYMSVSYTLYEGEEKKEMKDLVPSGWAGWI